MNTKIFLFSRKFQLFSAFGMFLSLMLGSQNSASAFTPFGKGDADSLAIINACPPKADCTLLAVIADPPAAGVVSVGTSLKYDKSRWSFRPDLSGFLCDFSSNGDCPPANAPVGTFLLSNLPSLDFKPGNPLPGSNVSLINDTVNGLVSLNYSFNSPLLSQVDRNFFMFMFESQQAFNPSTTIIQTFDKPGNYDFIQINATCSAIINGITNTCGSDTPIYGFNVLAVPEPSGNLGSIAVLVGIGFVFKRKHYQKKQSIKRIQIIYDN
jgi:hypothetical protein